MEELKLFAILEKPKNKADYFYHVHELKFLYSVATVSKKLIVYNYKGFDEDPRLLGPYTRTQTKFTAIVHTQNLTVMVVKH